MDNTRFWAQEDEVLDFSVRNEPKFQPCLRSIYPSLDERWKPSATNMDMIPDPVSSKWTIYPIIADVNQSAQTVLLKKSLIQDYGMIRLLPYHPQVWVARAATFLKLGYGELATADAYKAHLLCKAASVEGMKAREPGDGSLTAKVFGTILSELPQAETQSLPAYYIQVFSSINRTHGNAYLLMAQGLMSVSSWYDARYVLKEAKKAFPGNAKFRMLLVELKEKITFLKETMKVHGRDAQTVKEILHKGQLERVAYPWIVDKELERSVIAVRRLNSQFQAASTNACILRSPIGGKPTGEGVKEDDFGVYAQSDIQQGETILATRSIWTDCAIPNGDDHCLACCRILRNKDAIRLTSCTCLFCSKACRDEATTTYHDATCGGDFGWLYEASKGADKTFTDMIPLLLVKILGTAVHLGCNLLKVPCIESLKPNNDSVVPSSFRLSYNIIGPLQILENLGVDIFADLKFDSWALQTLIMRIEDSRVHKRSRGDLRYSIIDPLFSMFNHSCTPSASYRYEGGGTAMTVKAIRDIKKGEEIYISYVEPWIPEKERKNELWKRVGGLCGCMSCERERLAEAIALRCKKEREAEEKQRALEDKRRVLSERAAVEGERFVRKLRDLERAKRTMPVR